jgi:hypothetical protein
MEGVRPGASGMSPQMRKRVLITLAVVCAFLFVGGGLAAFMSRNDTICSDGKVPLAQKGAGLGQTEYLCQNGDHVVK